MTSSGPSCPTIVVQALEGPVAVGWPLGAAVVGFGVDGTGALVASVGASVEGCAVGGRVGSGAGATLVGDTDDVGEGVALGFAQTQTSSVSPVPPHDSTNVPAKK